MKLEVYVVVVFDNKPPSTGTCITELQWSCAIEWQQPPVVQSQNTDIHFPIKNSTYEAQLNSAYVIQTRWYTFLWYLRLNHMPLYIMAHLLSNHVSIWKKLSHRLPFGNIAAVMPWLTRRTWQVSGMYLSSSAPWASYQIRNIAGCACAGSAGNVFPVTAG